MENQAKTQKDDKKKPPVLETVLPQRKGPKQNLEDMRAKLQRKIEVKQKEGVPEEKNEPLHSQKDANEKEDDMSKSQHHLNDTQSYDSPSNQQETTEPLELQTNNSHDKVEQDEVDDTRNTDKKETESVITTDTKSEKGQKRESDEKKIRKRPPKGVANNTKSAKDKTKRLNSVTKSRSQFYTPYGPCSGDILKERSNTKVTFQFTSINMFPVYREPDSSRLSYHREGSFKREGSFSKPIQREKSFTKDNTPHSMENINTRPLRRERSMKRTLRKEGSFSSDTSGERSRSAPKPLTEKSFSRATKKEANAEDAKYPQSKVKSFNRDFMNIQKERHERERLRQKNLQHMLRWPEMLKQRQRYHMSLSTKAHSLPSLYNAGTTTKKTSSSLVFVTNHRKQQSNNKLPALTNTKNAYAQSTTGSM